MAKVEVPASWLGREAERLPQVCVLSGDEAVGTVAFQLVHTPAWTYLLLPFGVVPFLIAIQFTAERNRVELPVSLPLDLEDASEFFG